VLVFCVKKAKRNLAKAQKELRGAGKSLKKRLKQEEAVSYTLPEQAA
jgi:hypothetical protein